MNYRSAAGEAAVRERYLELLGQWPVPYEDMRVPTREGETFVVACGPVGAPPVLLLQGSGANAAMWRRDVAVWAADFRVYAVDVIGEPGLSAPSRPPLASGAYAGWLDDVLDGLGLSRASLVGVSLGGWLALDYAISRPDRVERLVLLSPSGIGRAKLGILVKAVLLAPFGRWGRRRLLRSAVGAGPDAARPDAAGPDATGAADDLVLGEFALLIFKHFRPRREAVPVFPDEALRRVTAPMLVIVGGRDAMLDSYGTARRLAQVVPHAEVRLLPAAGHLPREQAVPVRDFLGAPD
jgi:pimeloyl-ACP methyl ester carboxylesterase